MGLAPHSWKSNPNHSHEVKATIMYQSQVFTTINHLHAWWGAGPTKCLPRFIHGADDLGMATISDPLTAKVDNWGLTDPQGFVQFGDLDEFLGHPMWGLGRGDIVGNPNVMDVSQPYGMVVGVGCPGGTVFYRPVDELRARRLPHWIGLSDPENGLPHLDSTNDGISSVWIAKSTSIPALTDGLVGILAGWHSGVLSAYSLGSTDLRTLRLSPGEVTAAWVLSPGVPIVGLAVDDAHSLNRQAQNRIWAVALNALGELFYLTKFPKRQKLARGTKLNNEQLERFAFATGRTVMWNLVEPSRRVARPDPYGDMDIDGSYSPRSSWNGMCLSKEQVCAETREIEKFLLYPPKHFRKVCNGWDMRRKLEIDFAGDDENFAGEAIVVFECGLEGSAAAVKQYVRTKVEEEIFSPSMADSIVTIRPPHRTPTDERESIFGESPANGMQQLEPAVDDQCGRFAAAKSYSGAESSPQRPQRVEEWRMLELTFGSAKNVEITTTTIDHSTYATLLISEDPALGMTNISETSSQGSPSQGEYQNCVDIPGQRARFIAAGTKTGSIFVWDVRTPIPKAADIAHTVEPIRVIYTDSPEISCLAMTALQLVHGGNDGLVQAWDPLASTTDPIRTLNSRFSSRARRRLIQAQSSARGVGINLFAAGAICLDPDPTALRGMVSLGTFLKYWSYSSSATDHVKGSKRRLRRSDRGSNNHGGERFSATVRNTNLKGYIASEQREMQRENERRQREKAHLVGRFGVDLLGNEEEALAYARMLSEESLAADEERRRSQSHTRAISTPALSSSDWSSGDSTPADSAELKGQDQLDADIAEAIQRSLEDSRTNTPQEQTSLPTPETGGYEIPIKYARRGRKSPRPATSRSPPLASVAEGSESARKQKEMADFDFALQLSLAEEESCQSMEHSEEFPSLSPAAGKGKGKGKEKMV